MSSIRDALLNPTAIAVVIMHWIVALFALFGEDHTEPFHWYYEPLLTQVLLVINIPASFVTMILALPIAYVTGLDGRTADIWMYSVFIVSISAQWFVTGVLIGKLWSPSHSATRSSAIDLH